MIMPDRPRGSRLTALAAGHRSPPWWLPALLALGAAACATGAGDLGDGTGGDTGKGSGGARTGQGGAGAGGSGLGGATGGGLRDGGVAATGGAGGIDLGGAGGAAAGGVRDAGASDLPADRGATGAGGAGTGGITGAGGSNVVLPAGVSGLFPAPGVQGVCPDPPLRITFPAPPTLGTAGRIQVWNAAQTATPVATVDMAVAMATDTIGGLAFNVPRAVFVDGNAAVIYLRQHALAYGQTYYVTVESGAIRPATGAALAITSATAWRFSTAAAAPANRAALGVALDGSAAFCSVQGAIDALPAGNTAASTISIARGTYHEIIRFTAKNNVTLRGADRAATIIAATNNNNLNPGTAIRSLVGIDSSSGLVIDSLTIQNLTPQGGSQAEALRLQRCDQCIVRNANVYSLQDTLLFDGRVYVDNSLIAGNVDFVWGGGIAYFNNCEIRIVGRSGVIVQARNAVGANGYVFVDCRLTSDAGLVNSNLARIDAGVYPGSHVAYINCVMGPHISAAGWQLTAGTATASLRFWEYQSRTPAGALVNVGGRVAGVQITAAQATMMRTPSMVLGGWTPPAN